MNKGKCQYPLLGIVARVVILPGQLGTIDVCNRVFSMCDEILNGEERLK